MTVRSGTAAWARPTWRSLDWRPLVLVTGAELVAVLALGMATVTVPAPALAILAAALVLAAAVLALEDEARALLAALPTSGARRLVHRLVLVVPSTVAVLVLLGAAEAIADVVDAGPPGAAGAPSVAALGLSGLAVRGGLIRRSRRAGTIAAAVPGAWVLWGSIAGGPEIVVAAANAWSRQPGIVALIAVLVVVATAER